jgi:hypothetical protein
MLDHPGLGRPSQAIVMLNGVEGLPQSRRVADASQRALQLGSKDWLVAALGPLDWHRVAIRALVRLRLFWPGAISRQW